MIFQRLLIALLCLFPSIGIASIEFSKSENDKNFALKIAKPGNLLLELKREHNGVKYAELMYIYDEVRMRWEQNGDLIELYRLPTYSDRGEEELAFVFRHHSDTGVLTFEPKGILENQDYYEFFEDREWLPANQLSDPAYQMHINSRDQPRTFYKVKSKGSFPEDTPAVLMNVGARLFRDRVHELRVLLVYPDLDEDTLRVVAETMFNEEYDQHARLQPLAAGHPNMPKDLRDRFFESEDSSFKTYIWRAVAMREDESEERYQEYLRRIKEGEERDRILVARDSLAPVEAWEVALAPEEHGALKAFSRNPNAPPEMILEIFKSGALKFDARGMAMNQQTPPAVLDELSNTDDRRILWDLLRNPSTPEATIEKILSNFANNQSARLRGDAGRDGRTPVDLLEQLVDDVNTRVRAAVAMNKKAPVPLLEQLAKDSHRMVASRARKTLKENDRALYNEKKESWAPLDQLNPHDDLNDEFRAALKAGDQEAARRLVNLTDDPETRIDAMGIVSSIQNYNFEGFKDLMQETMLGMEPKSRISIFKGEQATPEQLSWAIEAGFVTSENIRDALSDYARKGRHDLIQVLEDTGMIDSPGSEIATVCLFYAVLRNDPDQIRFWLNKGGDPQRKIDRSMSPLDAARKMHLLTSLELLDQEGRYTEFIEKIRKEFPIPKNQSLVGSWTNRKDSFGEATMSLREDGTGTLGATMVALPFLWKEVGGSQIEFAFVDPEAGELVDKRMQLEIVLNQEELPDQQSSQLELKAIDANQTFYRIPERKSRGGRGQTQKNKDQAY